jgi:hypothetical protein
MAEKEVLEIGVEVTNEGALVAHNANLDKNDQANQRVIASSAKLDSAISRNNATYAALNSQLTNVGRGAQEAFAKFEAGAVKVNAIGQAIGQSQKKFDDLNKALQSAVSSYGENSAEAEGLRSELDALGATIASLDTDFSSASEELVALGSAFDESIAGSEDAQAAAADYADSLVELQGAATDTASEVAHAGVELGKTGDAAGKGKAGVEDLGSEFGKLSKTLSGLPGPLGAAGNAISTVLGAAEKGGGIFELLAGGISSFALVAGGITVVLAGIAAAVSAGIAEFTDYGSAVSEAAQKTGLSVEFISGFAEAADDASLALRGTGVEVRDIASELEGFSLKLGKAIDANGGVSETGKQLSRALNELGVSLTDANGKLKDTPALLGDIADAFQRIGPGPQAESIARTLDLANALPLLAKGREAINAVAGQAIFTTADAAALIKYQQGVDELSDAFKRLKISIGSFTIGPLTSVLNGVNSKIRETQLYFSALDKYLKGDFLGGATDVKAAQVLGGLIEDVQQYGESFNDAHDRAAAALVAIRDEIDQTNSRKLTPLQLEQAAQDDERQKDLKERRDNGKRIDQETAAARTAAALERSSKATEALTRLQENLAKSAGLVASAFDGEVKSLGKLEQAKVLLDLAQGKTTLADFQKTQVAAGLSEGVAKGSIPIAKGVAIAAELGRGNISPQAAALALPSTQRKEVLGNIDAVTKGNAEVQRLIAENQITPEALQQQLAQTRVPVVRRLTTNVPLQQKAQDALAAQQGVNSIQEAQKSAIKQAQDKGVSEADLRVLGDSFNAPLEAAKKAAAKAEAEYNTIKPKIDSTLATPFISQQKQLTELANQRDTTVRELKQRNASQDEINKANNEFNDKIKKQTETNKKANELFGAGAVGPTVTTTTTQVVGARVIGEKGAANIKDQIDKVFGTTGGQAQIDIKLNAAGFEKIEELQTAFANLKKDDQVKLLVSLSGAADAEELFKKLDDAPSQKEIELALKTSGATSIDDLLTFINHPDQTEFLTFKATLDAFGATTPEEFKNKLALLSDNEIVLALKASGIDDPEKLLATIRGQVSGGVTVPVVPVAQPVAAGNPLLTPQGFGLPAQITVPVAAGAVPPASTKDANDALDGVKDKTVNLKVDNTDLLAKVKSGNEQIAAMPDRTILLKGDTSDLDLKVSNSNKAVDAMPNKTVLLYADNQGVLDAVTNAKIALNSLPASKTIDIHVVTHNQTVTDKCFAPGTPIATPRGHVPIEEIVAGDTVYAYDHAASRTVEATVKQTFTNHAELMVHVLFLRGVVLVSSFTCTPAHPVWSITRNEYIEAGQLHQGEAVLDINGEALTVAAWLFTLGGPTHNFEVEIHNNYFASGVLVHNLSERIDRQLAGLVGSLANLKYFGAPGALESAQRMITHTLLPQNNYNTVSHSNSRSVNVYNPTIQAAGTPDGLMGAFEVMAGMAGVG